MEDGSGLIRLEALAKFLDGYFDVEAFPGDANGIYRPSSRPVRRIGLALEPWNELADWAERAKLDALFLHRPWKLELARLDACAASNSDPEPLGILAYHLAFDEKLTIGYNARLGDALGMTELETCGEKEGRPIGMLGRIAEQSSTAFQEQVKAIFGGLESVQSGKSATVTTVATVGAMTEKLVREAADHGAEAYVTGQFRVAAQQAVADTGMMVIEVGHRRSEVWGLRALGGVLQERWAGLNVVVGE